MNGFGPENGVLSGEGAVMKGSFCQGGWLS
jgi:hypothetical protein